MSRRVFITGAGLISSLGDSPAQLHRALCAGRSGIGGIRSFTAPGLNYHSAAEIKSFQAEKYLGPINLRPLDRTSRLAASAARLALEDSGWSAEMVEHEEIGLVLGTMFGSLQTISEFDRRILDAGPAYVSPMNFANTVINAAAGQTAIVHKLRGVNSTISTGPTSGLQAIAYATDLIRSGRARAVLAGGAEEFCFQSFYNFHRAGLLCASNHGHGATPFAATGNGFVLGEGAALLMLEDETSAQKRGARVLAEIVGHACGYDSSSESEESDSIDVIARTMDLALADAEAAPSEIDCISASANGSVVQDRREAQAVNRIFGAHAQRIPVTAIKSMLGETLGASGALQVVSMIEIMRDGVLPGIASLENLKPNLPLRKATSGNQRIEVRVGLVNCIGFDGQCCCLVIANHKPDGSTT